MVLSALRGARGGAGVFLTNVGQKTVVFLVLEGFGVCFQVAEAYDVSVADDLSVVELGCLAG